MKKQMKKLIRKMGYDIHRAESPREGPESADERCARQFDAYAYYTRWQAPFPLFTPFAGHPDFMKAYDGIQSSTQVSPERCYILQAFLRHAVNLPGDVAECGVFKGGTALLAARTIQGSRKTLHLFDSFQGLSEATPGKDNYYKKGDFADTSEQAVRRLLADFSDNVEFHVGWIPETFRNLPERMYSFVHVDVDLFQPALDCCNYYYPRLVPGGAMVFDDYGFPACRGEKEAVDSFCAGTRDSVITLLTGQGLIIKTAVA